VALLAWWKGLVLVLLIGLMLFTYLHDGPPYWEWSDVADNVLHHEKIFILLGIVALAIFLWPPRNRFEWIMYTILVVVLLALMAIVLQ